jgi:hypothetical protein
MKETLLRPGTDAREKATRLPNLKGNLESSTYRPKAIPVAIPVAIKLHLKAINGTLLQFLA